MSSETFSNQMNGVDDDVSSSDDETNYMGGSRKRKNKRKKTRGKSSKKSKKNKKRNKTRKRKNKRHRKK